MKPFDAHIHILSDHPDVLKRLGDLDLKVLNICVPVDNHGEWRRTRGEKYLRLHQDHPDTFEWCTGFDLPRFEDPRYAEACIEGLKRDFSLGAVGCKVWKNVGMEVRKVDGSYIQIDDALFTPIFEYLESANKTVLLHMAEPLACWRPLEEGKPHTGYYKQNPQWHMYNKPEYPSHETIIAARDRLLERHPGLRMVGAHLGSLEWDVDEVAKRLECYPNFAVDTSARLWDLICQDSEKVRAFFMKHQDRILHGIDHIIPQHFETLEPQKQTRLLDSLQKDTEVSFQYYSTTEAFTYNNTQTKGLGLPDDVLEKICKTNVRKWYPDIDKAK